MKKLFTVVALLCAALAAPAFAADPIVGSWTLNTAKSKFSHGNELKSGTRTYTETSGTYTLEQKLTGADGKEQSMTVQYKDGEDNKMSAGTLDEIHAKKVNDHTWDFDLRKGGKTVGHVHRTVSADGKTLKVHNTGMQPSGKSGDETLVFDKQ
ncbi:MAG: hypothetical protein JO341_07925 [Gammaproteobacteria bacterium]|nr:hypothetical protein [Gammaproteobacteria bacterium]MBV9620937.1 hypothetical protein [Gammaproteobacteria bacterium]